MKTKKSTAFWTTLWFLAACVAVVAWRAPEALVGVLPAVLTALVGNAAVYCGANVADNYTRSKHYRAELDPNTQNGGT